MAELPFFTGEEARGRVLVLLFFVSALIVTVWGTWGAALPGNHEAIIAESARETAAAGRPLPILFDGAPLREIPPLAPWLISLFFMAFGAGEFAARFGFVLLSVAASLALLRAGQEAACGWEPPGRGSSSGEEEAAAPREGAFAAEVGLLSAISLAATPLFGRYAPHVSTEIPTAFFTALALLGWLLSPRRRLGAALWAVSLAGGILSGGSVGLLVAIGAGAVAAFERAGRLRWKDPWFVAATVVGIALPMLWLVPAGREGGFFGSPLWRPISAIVRPESGAAAAIAFGFKDVWLRTLPWSIPTTVAVVRTVFLRGGAGPGKAASREIESALFIFMAVMFLPLALGGAEPMRKFLPVLPFGALLAAREIARWVSSAAPYPARRVRQCNQALTALFLLLMLVIVATPLRIRGTGMDPIRAIARVAGRIVPAGERVGNYRQPVRDRGARMLFYGGRGLEEPLSTPDQVASALRANPGKVFLSSVADMESLRAQGVLPSGIRVLFGEGELVLFGVRDVPSGEAP